VYLSKLPRLDKKIRVAIDWTLDLIFAKDFVQFLTVRGQTMSTKTAGAEHQLPNLSSHDVVKRAEVA
jgi:hypothetical protein